MCKVVGIFFSEPAAQAMAKELREKGFEGNISLVAKGQEDDIEEDYGKQGNAPYSGVDSITDGTATGSFIGGLAGMFIGTGAIILPGLGAVMALGPVAGLLSGALSGGIAGALVDYGIPETEGREYEHHIKSGAILAIVATTRERLEEVAELMRAHGATKVRSHIEH